MHTRRAPPILAATIALMAPAATVVADDARPLDGDPWVRLSDHDNGWLSLEILQRTYEPADGDGPTVTLVGAVHIANQIYYRNIQEELDGYDLVLYEGVNPAGVADAADLPMEEQIRSSENRVRLVGVMLEQAKRRDGAYPASLDALAESLADKPRPSRWLETARADAWSNELVYARTADGEHFVLLSLGADGEPGGRRSNADLRLADQDPLTDAELGAAPNLQERMAQTFRLSFQLTEMDDTRANWRNSDMSIDELQRAFEKRGADGSMLFGMLDGSSMTGAIASTVLRIVELMPGGPQMGKLMIMEMLSLGDAAFEAMGDELGEGMLEVLIEDRNQVVIDDLAGVIASEPGVESVAIWYGAGHMPDMVERLVEQLGYRPSDEESWNPAMRLNLGRAGVTDSQRRMMQLMIRRQLEQMGAGGE